MIQPITEREWMGLTLEQATNKANGINYIIRIVETNGKSLMLDTSVKSNRVNIRLRDDIIIGLYTG